MISIVHIAETHSESTINWVSDVTCFKINNSYLYICLIIDLCSRKVIGYRTSLRNSTQLITKTFRAAFIECNAKAGLVFHSNRGANYTLNSFQKLLKSSVAGNLSLCRASPLTMP